MKIIPDKTFPLSVVGDLLASTSPEEVVFMPDKIYFDGVDTSTTPRLAINEEYIRKDYLLEWAEKFYEMYMRITEQGGSDLDFGKMNAFSMMINKLNEI